MLPDKIYNAKQHAKNLKWFTTEELISILDPQYDYRVNTSGIRNVRIRSITLFVGSDDKQV